LLTIFRIFHSQKILQTNNAVLINIKCFRFRFRFVSLINWECKKMHLVHPPC